MRSQILTMKNSSQSEQSKYNILVNELIRRFEVMDDEIDTTEKIEVVDHYTQQLINSGYNGEQVRDIIESGLKGMKKRREERKKARGSRFRSAEETIEERTTKKLIESTTWYKDREQEEEDPEDKMKRRNDKENSWSGERKVNKKRKRVTEIEVEGKKKIMSVVFVPHTYKSELAKRLRERLEKLEKLGSLKLKVVEKTGEKLVDLLHRSDAWSDMDCSREDCLICGSAGEKERKGNAREET